MHYDVKEVVGKVELDRFNTIDRKIVDKKVKGELEIEDREPLVDIFKRMEKGESFAFKEINKPVKPKKARDGTFEKFYQDFMWSESQMMNITPKCGSCACGSCPLEGCRYTLQGEKEMKLIEDGLSYEGGRWMARLPWKYPEEKKKLDMTVEQGLRTMHQVEKSLSKNLEDQDCYNKQIEEMVQRGVVDEVSQEEFDQFKDEGGVTFFLPHLAVHQPHKVTTPVRICWDASRQQAHGVPRLNDIIAKGPDGIVPDLASIIINFRYGRHASIADIKKMHNRVLLQREDSFMQLFMWRSCDKHAKPKIMRVKCNTFGLRSSNAIATAALRKSAEIVKEEVKQEEVDLTEKAEKKAQEALIAETEVKNSIEKLKYKALGEMQKMKQEMEVIAKNAAEMAEEALEKAKNAKEQSKIAEEAEETIHKQCYIDDLSEKDLEKMRLEKRKKMLDRFLAHAAMPTKGWITSGESKEIVEIGKIVDPETEDDERLIEKNLGMSWDVFLDFLFFVVKLKLTGKSAKKSMGDPVLTRQDFKDHPIVHLTRRMALSETSKVYDPTGLIAPLILKAKIMIKRNWGGNVKDAPKWDDAFLLEDCRSWNDWFIDLLDLDKIKFRRSVVPDESFEGQPMLVLFSDGSKEAYGAVGYLRFVLTAGGVFVSLLCARSRVAKKAMVSIPRIELAGAITANRIKKFILEKTCINPEETVHLVDSTTVMYYVNNNETVLPPWENARSIEIQKANEVTEEGLLKNWGWIPGKENIGDWTTKPRKAKELGEGSVWQNGPAWLKKPKEEWPVKWHWKPVKEETECNEIVVIERKSNRQFDLILDLIERKSDWFTVLRSVATVVKWKMGTEDIVYRVKTRKNAIVHKPLKKGVEKDDLNVLTKGHLDRAEEIIVEALQWKLLPELEKPKGEFRNLSPTLDGKIWKVGERMQKFVGFTRDNKMPVLLPKSGKGTDLIMKKCHEELHGGCDQTLASYRLAGYWSPQARKVARKIRKNCKVCEKEKPTLLEMKMGDHKQEILEATTPFEICQVDLMGPFVVKVKRSTEKRWALVLMDVVSNAVYCDIISDYSTAAVMMTLTRFGSLYGWPTTISSDPGSQLVSAGGNLESWWQKMEKD